MGGLLLLAGPGWTFGAISPEELARKREGWFVSGVPLAGYTTDVGFAYGVRAYLTNNAKATDPYFKVAPYHLRIYVQYFATTLGREYHAVGFDCPHVRNTEWRVRGEAAVEHDTNRNYFGDADRSMRALPGGSFSSYQRMLNAERPAGPDSTNGFFNKYTLERPALWVQTERRVDPAWIMTLGFLFEKTKVKPYDGLWETVSGTRRRQGPTLLTETRPVGIAGGWVNSVIVGLGWDTRDYEPAPRTGWYMTAIADLGTAALGSDYPFARETLAVRRYQPISPSVTGAVRLVYARVDRRAPFFELSSVDYGQGLLDGLGGTESLRGFKEIRFDGPSTGLATVEVRWDALRFRWLNQLFLLTPTAFADAGRVFSRARDFRLTGWKPDAGAGLYVAWSQSTVGGVTYGRSAEDWGLYFTFGHQF